ncbi:DUF1640 domain-containing protein [uncultured Methylobacterium sp.]|uniref:DUF1640 domain-containing protein n=1 Tax=uncultured Methylobacterium sp. TaxID=157278 RepID=UPI0035C9576B
MTAVAFDTLKYARTLREKAKLSTEQVEGLANAMGEVLDGTIPTKSDIGAVRSDIEALRLATQADTEALRLTTKADIEALRLATQADIEALRLSTKADIEAAKSEIIRWMFGAIGFQTVVIVGAVVPLGRSLH